ncbi:hypothetical protein M426DRAFT_264513 [Hypoxylon sp. CI-4A]|nr:hypothetical protein M426DRAFT_264513 [Hypoxylon sp. CI-4A]
MLAIQAAVTIDLAYSERIPYTFKGRLQSRTSEACGSLSTSLPDQLFWPNSTQYSTETTDIWSETCLLSPSCVFEPNTAEDLSQGLKLIKMSGSKLSVRSGGHMPVPGAQSLDDGVMISMSRFNTQALNSDKTIASIGPGQTWIDVYTWLAQSDLVVNGGRYPSVGVGGELIGGGIGYFSGSRGWGCNDIVGYEVVLADGGIVYATGENTTFSDLFWALKGGHNNFGIVTRFDMRTIPIGSIYGGFLAWNGGAKEQFFDALEDYMAPGGGVDDPHSAINAFASIQPAKGSSSYSLENVILYSLPDPSPVALRGFTSINSSYLTTSEVSLHTTWTDIPNLLGQFSNRNGRSLFWSISYKGDPQAISIHNHTVIDGALEELTHVAGLTIYATWQPISKSWLEISQRSGDAIALDPETDGTFIAGMITSLWDNEEDDEAVYAFVEKAAQKIQSETTKVGLYNPFIYLNDAAKTQKPFDALGGGKSLPRLKEIQAKYDPDGFIKNYLQHGFSLE